MKRSVPVLLATCLGVSIGLAQNPISLSVLSTYSSGIFDGGAAEIVAFDEQSKRVFVSNGNGNTLGLIDLRDPAHPTLIKEIDLSPYGAGVNSVAVKNGLVAVACEAAPKQEPGVVAFLDTDGGFISSVTVGALPDMVAFTPDGRYVLVANEGEPNDAYTVDPEGSISVINLKNGAALLTQRNVKTASFKRFNRYKRLMKRAHIRIFGPNASVAQDLEPEYIAISKDSKTAMVTLQENNAIAILDIRSAKVKRVKSLGYKWHILPGNGLDASDKDGGINIENWPVAGMFQPDSIASYHVRGRNYYVIANEGDSRDYAGFSEESNVGSITLAPWLTRYFPEIQKDEFLGRLGTTTEVPFGKHNGVYHQLFSFGARSFSILDERGHRLYDSGDDFEQITARAYPEHFNATSDKNKFDNRSDNKGPEPEGVAVGEVNGRFYAFIGLERVGGIMVYDVTNPRNATFVQYINNRDFGQNASSPEAGDLGPEGLVFIHADKSPNGSPLLVVANEISGTTTIYEVDDIE